MTESRLGISIIIKVDCLDFILHLTAIQNDRYIRIGIPSLGRNCDGKIKHMFSGDRCSRNRSTDLPIPLRLKGFRFFQYFLRCFYTYGNGDIAVPVIQCLVLLFQGKPFIKDLIFEFMTRFPCVHIQVSGIKIIKNSLKFGKWESKG